MLDIVKLRSVEMNEIDRERCEKWVCRECSCDIQLPQKAFIRTLSAIHTISLSSICSCRRWRCRWHYGCRHTGATVSHLDETRHPSLLRTLRRLSGYPTKSWQTNQVFVQDSGMWRAKHEHRGWRCWRWWWCLASCEGQLIIMTIRYTDPYQWVEVFTRGILADKILGRFQNYRMITTAHHPSPILRVSHRPSQPQPRTFCSHMLWYAMMDRPKAWEGGEGHKQTVV